MPGTVLGSGDPMVTEINCFLNASNLGIHFFKGKEIKEVIRAGGGGTLKEKGQSVQRS